LFANVPGGNELINDKSFTSPTLMSLTIPIKQGSCVILSKGDGTKAILGGQLYNNQDKPGSYGGPGGFVAIAGGVKLLLLLIVKASP
jgi:hypothetical protein